MVLFRRVVGAGEVGDELCEGLRRVCSVCAANANPQNRRKHVTQRPQDSVRSFGRAAPPNPPRSGCLSGLRAAAKAPTSTAHHSTPFTSQLPFREGEDGVVRLSSSPGATIREGVCNARGARGEPGGSNCGCLAGVTVQQTRQQRGGCVARNSSCRRARAACPSSATPPDLRMPRAPRPHTRTRTTIAHHSQAGLAHTQQHHAASWHGGAAGAGQAWRVRPPLGRGRRAGQQVARARESAHQTTSSRRGWWQQQWQRPPAAAPASTVSCWRPAQQRLAAAAGARARLHVLLVAGG
jgi:hypothetical protein